MRFSGTGVKTPPEYIRFIVCREMGWDYWTYAIQPTNFVQEIITCMEAEAINNEINNQKLENKK